jgi:hypothetical protein
MRETMVQPSASFLNITSIRSGGQTGVDRAALDVAVAKNIQYSGWCPRNGWAEDFAKQPGLVGKYNRLMETPSASPEQRTAWNVRDSHATLILQNRGDAPSSGTLFTKLCADLIFLRPCYSIDIDAAGAIEEARQWLTRVFGMLNGDFNLNIAGPRESECPGIYTSAYDFLFTLL